MADDDNGDIIPENTEIIVFAEDLVNYIMFNSMSMPYLSTRVDRYRTVVYNHFTPTVRVAANFIARQLEKNVNDDFDYFAMENSVNQNTFLTYMSYIQESYPMLTFNAKKFFTFSVHLSMMAAKFSLAWVIDAPDLTVTAIVEKFQSCEMTSDAWNSVHELASAYARIYKDMDDVLTPDSDSDRDSTESALSDTSKSSSPEEDYDDPENRSFKLDPSKGTEEGENISYSPNGDETWQCKTFEDIFEETEHANMQRISQLRRNNFHSSDSSTTQSELSRGPFMEERHDHVRAVSPSEGSSFLSFHSNAEQKSEFFQQPVVEEQPGRIQPIIPFQRNQFHSFDSYAVQEIEEFQWPITELQQQEVATVSPFQVNEFLSFVGNAMREMVVFKDEESL